MNEIKLIRAIACLCVVLLHSIKFKVGFEYNGSDIISHILLTLAGLLSFGTPTFVFISSLLLAYTYKHGLPSGFYLKRVKLILLPFIFMGIFYGLVSNLDDLSNIPKYVILNLLGNYHGWFVLVIFQFYFLHQVFTKYDKRIKPSLALSFSFIVSIIYLIFFNITNPHTKNIYILDFWERSYIIPFFGWFCYFVLAYYCGKNYESFIQNIERFKIWIYSALPLTTGLIVLNNIYGDFNYGSKRFDMIFFTLNIIMILFLITHKVKKVPVIFEVISTYSFGIYLVHWFWLVLLTKIYNYIGIEIGFFSIPIFFFGSILSSITMINILNKWDLGKYLVGKIGRNTKK